MPRPDFDALRDELRRSGIAPRDIGRTVAELRDHYDDLVDAALARGDHRDAAEYEALSQLGEMPVLAQAFAARRELKIWAYRYPRVALVVYPLAFLAALPAAPILSGVAHAPQLARWGMSIFLGGLITATTMLVLQLSIALS